ncbi:MAG: M20 aminoacylase family protein [Thalassobaculales bacterium]
MPELEQLLAELRGDEAEMTAIRHDIHRHPETAFEENRTADLVAGKLTQWGIDIHRGLARTGVVGTIRGKRPGQRAIALRADMDALNLVEKNIFEHRSVFNGKMHACGHDGHTAMLLGAAKYLSAHRDFAGTVHLIFQPAEEGEGGARVMIEEGLFDLFPCDAVYGMHNMPGIPAGHFAIRPGPMLASSDTWEVTFRGTGGHGSAPHKGTDPTVPMAQFITALQGIVGRNVSPLDTAVLSVGHIHAGSAGSPNVIPSEVLVRGTARSFRQEVREMLAARFKALAEACAAAWDCTAEANYIWRYPPLVNSAEQTRLAVAAATAVAGAPQVDADVEPVTGAEDFAFMLQRKPGAYIMLGNGDGGGGPCHYVHTPHYDFNDQILSTGAAYWVKVVELELGALAA